MTKCLNILFCLRQISFERPISFWAKYLFFVGDFWKLVRHNSLSTSEKLALTRFKLVQKLPLFHWLQGHFIWFPAGIYLLKVYNRNTRTRQWHCSIFFSANFEHISHLVLVFLLLTLKACNFTNCRSGTKLCKASHFLRILPNN